MVRAVQEVSSSGVQTWTLFAKQENIPQPCASISTRPCCVIWLLNILPAYCYAKKGQEVAENDKEQGHAQFRHSYKVRGRTSQHCATSRVISSADPPKKRKNLPILLVAEDNCASLMGLVAFAHEADAVFLCWVVLSGAVSEFSPHLDQEIDIPRRILAVAFCIWVKVPVE